MCIAGLFLIVAACFKVHQLLTSPIPEDAFLIDTWLFAVIQVPLELGLGIWLMSGLFVKGGWLIATVGYGTFVGITTWRLVTGQESCGCFGSFHVAPEVTLFAIDIPIFLGLTIFRPKGEKFLAWPSAKHFWSVAIPTAIILIAILPTLIFNKPLEENPDEWITPKDPTEQVIKITDPTEQSTNTDNGQGGKEPVELVDTGKGGPVENGGEEKPPVEPEVEKWEHLENIDIAEVISSGMKITVLHRHDCDKCHETLPIFEEYAEMFGTDSDSIRIALVELPPFGESTGYVIPEDTKCLQGKFTKKLLVQTPVIVALFDGEVQKVWTSEDETPTIDDLMAAFGGE
jgi:hypothetical protein